MAPVEGNETLDSGSTHQAGRAGRRLVATRRLRHPGAELVDLSRQVEDDGVQLPDAPNEKTKSLLSGDVLGGIHHALDGWFGSVDSHFDQGDGLLGDRTKVLWIRFHDRQHILFNQWRRSRRVSGSSRHVTALPMESTGVGRRRIMRSRPLTRSARGQRSWGPRCAAPKPTTASSRRATRSYAKARDIPTSSPAEAALSASRSPQVPVGAIRFQGSKAVAGIPHYPPQCLSDTGSRYT
jgi:hypothetical protein